MVLMRKNSWGKFIVLSVILGLLMSFGGLMMPGVASAAAPLLQTAEVTSNGDISLTFDQDIADPTGIGAEGQFTVTVDSLSVSVTAVVKTNTSTKIKLVLESKITAGQTAEVVYNKSDDVNKQVKAVADSTAVDSFAAQQVTNNLQPPPTEVFAIAGDGVSSTSYTMEQLKAMNPTTDTYPGKNDAILSCKGVALAEMLNALNVTGDSLMVQINTTDAASYPVDPVTLASVLDPAGKYLLTYEVDGQAVADATSLRIYWSGKVIKNVLGLTISRPVSENPKYTVAPVADAAYTAGTTDKGINIMTVNSGISGFKYFAVNITPVTPHEGNEVVVFTHLRGGNQLGINAAKADFDLVNAAQAGFNVRADDIIKAYIVDDLTNSTTVNPIVFQ